MDGGMFIPAWVVALVPVSWATMLGAVWGAWRSLTAKVDELRLDAARRDGAEAVAKAVAERADQAHDREFGELRAAVTSMHKRLDGLVIALAAGNPEIRVDALRHEPTV